MAEKEKQNFWYCISFCGNYETNQLKIILSIQNHCFLYGLSPLFPGNSFSFFWMHPQKSQKHMIHNLLWRLYPMKLKFFSSSFWSQQNNFVSLKMKNDNWIEIFWSLLSLKGKNLHFYIIQNINFNHTLRVLGNTFFQNVLALPIPSFPEKKVFPPQKIWCAEAPRAEKEQKGGSKTQCKLSPN